MHLDPIFPALCALVPVVLALDILLHRFRQSQCCLGTRGLSGGTTCCVTTKAE